jgi:hypothetical protein
MPFGAKAITVTQHDSQPTDACGVANPFPIPVDPNSSRFNIKLSNSLRCCAIQPSSAAARLLISCTA